MSKVGKKPILIPQGVTLKIEVDNICVQGKEGNIVLRILPFTQIELKDNQVFITSTGNNKQARANWGTMRALIKNAVDGVSAGYIKELEIQGIGFRATMEGNNLLVLSVGFSHPVKFSVPDGIKVAVEKSFIKISGFDKYLVGQVAAKIRAIKKPEPYLGKGIRYKGEVVARKEGKKAAGATGAAAA